MELLIFFYDNFLIYYPNIFFATLFLFGILTAIVTIKGIVYLNKELKKIIREIKNDISKIRINKIEIKKTKIYENFSLAGFIKKFLIRMFIKNFSNALKIIKNIFIGINEALEYLQLMIEKIFKKIEKEIFIGE